MWFLICFQLKANLKPHAYLIPLQLHTYVYIVPTTPAEDNSSVASSGFASDHTPTAGRVDKLRSSTDSGMHITYVAIEINCMHVPAGMQLKEFMGGAKGAGLLSHLTPEERRSVLGTSAAQDMEDLEQFAKYVYIIIVLAQNNYY